MKATSGICSAATMLWLGVLIIIHLMSSYNAKASHLPCATGCQCYQLDGLRAANCTRLTNISTIAHHLEVLRMTELHDNHFTVKENTFASLTILKRLYLNHLSLHKLYPGAFKGLKQLEVLDVSNNRFAAPSEFSKAVNELPNLRRLILRGNPLGKPPMLTLETLLYLDLGSCKIGNISENAFKNLIHLKHLRLDDNHITIIKAKMFPVNIISLDFSENKIKYITKNEFSTLDNLERIELSGNPIHCTCDLLKIRYDFIMNKPLICEYPEEYRGVDLMSLKKTQVCHSKAIGKEKRIKRDLGNETEREGDDYVDNEYDDEDIHDDDDDKKETSLTENDRNEEEESPESIMHETEAEHAEPVKDSDEPVVASGTHLNEELHTSETQGSIEEAVNDSNVNKDNMDTQNEGAQSDSAASEVVNENQADESHHADSAHEELTHTLVNSSEDDDIPDKTDQEQPEHSEPNNAETIHEQLNENISDNKQENVEKESHDDDNINHSESEEVQSISSSEEKQEEAVHEHLTENEHKILEEAAQDDDSDINHSEPEEVQSAASSDEKQEVVVHEHLKGEEPKILEESAQDDDDDNINHSEPQEVQSAPNSEEKQEETVHEHVNENVLTNEHETLEEPTHDQDTNHLELGEIQSTPNEQKEEVIHEDKAGPDAEDSVDTAVENEDVSNSEEAGHHGEHSPVVDTGASPVHGDNPSSNEHSDPDNTNTDDNEHDTSEDQHLEPSSKINLTPVNEEHTSNEKLEESNNHADDIETVNNEENSLEIGEASSRLIGQSSKSQEENEETDGYSADEEREDSETNIHHSSEDDDDNDDDTPTENESKDNVEAADVVDSGTHHEESIYNEDDEDSSPEKKIPSVDIRDGTGDDTVPMEDIDTNEDGSSEVVESSISHISHDDDDDDDEYDNEDHEASSHDIHVPPVNIQHSNEKEGETPAEVESNHDEKPPDVVDSSGHHEEEEQPENTAEAHLHLGPHSIAEHTEEKTAVNSDNDSEDTVEDAASTDDETNTEDKSTDVVDGSEHVEQAVHSQDIVVSEHPPSAVEDDDESSTNTENDIDDNDDYDVENEDNSESKAAGVIDLAEHEKNEENHDADNTADHDDANISSGSLHHAAEHEEMKNDTTDESLPPSQEDTEPEISVEEDFETSHAQTINEILDSSDADYEEKHENDNEDVASSAETEAPTNVEEFIPLIISSEDHNNNEHDSESDTVDGIVTSNIEDNVDNNKTEETNSAVILGDYEDYDTIKEITESPEITDGSEHHMNVIFPPGSSEVPEEGSGADESLPFVPRLNDLTDENDTDTSTEESDEGSGGMLLIVPHLGPHSVVGHTNEKEADDSDDDSEKANEDTKTSKHKEDTAGNSDNETDTSSSIEVSFDRDFGASETNEGSGDIDRYEDEIPITIPVESDENSEYEDGITESSILVPVDEQEVVKQHIQPNLLGKAVPSSEPNPEFEEESNIKDNANKEEITSKPMLTNDTHGNIQQGSVNEEGIVSGAAPEGKESDQSSSSSAGSYAVLGVIMALIVVLLGYSVIRSRRQRQRRSMKKDVENPGRELLDVSKPLIENNHSSGKQLEKDETQQPLMSKEKEAALTIDPSENENVKKPQIFNNGHANHSPKSNNKDYLGDQDKTDVPEVVVEKHPHQTVTDAPAPVQNSYKDSSPNKQGNEDEGDDEVFSNGVVDKPVVPLRTSSVPPNETNGNLAPPLVNGNGIAPLSPNSGRVKVVAKELPDSVAKRPVIIVNRGTDPPV